MTKPTASTQRGPHICPRRKRIQSSTNAGTGPSNLKEKSQLERSRHGGDMRGDGKEPIWDVMQGDQRPTEWEDYLFIIQYVAIHCALVHILHIVVLMSIQLVAKATRVSHTCSRLVWKDAACADYPLATFHHYCSLSPWRVVRGSKLMHLDSLIHGLFIT